MRGALSLLVVGMLSSSCVEVEAYYRDVGVSLSDAPGADAAAPEDAELDGGAHLAPLSEPERVNPLILAHLRAMVQPAG